MRVQIKVSWEGLRFSISPYSPISDALKKVAGITWCKVESHRIQIERFRTVYTAIPSPRLGRYMAKLENGETVKPALFYLTFKERTE